MRDELDEDRARALAVFSGTGATLILAALVLTTPAFGLGRALLVPVIAYAFTLILWWKGDHMPPWCMDLILAIGSVLVTFGVFATGAIAESLPMFYVWVSLYAFYFLPLRRAVLQLVLVAVMCAVALPAIRSAPAAAWVLTVGTSAIAGLWVTMLARRIRRLVRTDALTGVYNRRAWEEELPKALERARRLRRPMSVAMLDLDHFKAFNDRYGHPAGDKVLRETAQQLSKSLRKTDLLARYGGEEFAAIFDCDLTNAETLARRLLEQLSPAVTCSVGVASWNGREPLESLLQRADAALYDAKKSGRNRVTTAPELARMDQPRASTSTPPTR